MRDLYCRHLLNLAPKAPILLVTLDHAPHEKEGPPFPVTLDEVEQRFGSTHTIMVVESRDVLDENPAFKNRGVSALKEHVFLLTPK